MAKVWPFTPQGNARSSAVTKTITLHKKKKKVHNMFKKYLMR